MSTLQWSRREEPARRPPASPGLHLYEHREFEEERLLLADVKANAVKDGFGAKRISFFGGFCLLANNITGPGNDFYLEFIFPLSLN